MAPTNYSLVKPMIDWLGKGKRSSRIRYVCIHILLHLLLIATNMFFLWENFDRFLFDGILI